MNQRSWRQILEHIYLVGVCFFLFWEVSAMTEAPWMGLDAIFPYIGIALAALGLALCRLRLGPLWVMVALLGWIFINCFVRDVFFDDSGLLEAQMGAINNGVLAIMVIAPTALVVTRKRLAAYMRVLLMLWTAAFTVLAVIGIWAALTGHVVNSLAGSWETGLLAKNNRLLLMSHATTGAVRMGLSVILATLGAVMTNHKYARWGYAACGLVQMASMALTDCRTSFIALGASLGLMLLIQIVRCGVRHGKPRGAWLRWACGFAVVAVLTLGTYRAMTGTLELLAPHVKHDLEDILLTDVPAEMYISDEERAELDTEEVIETASRAVDNAWQLYETGEIEQEEVNTVKHRKIASGNMLNGRTKVWEAALMLMVFNPVYLLVGMTSVYAPILINVPIIVMGRFEYTYPHVHNIYLQTLVSWGIPGFVLLAVFCVFFLRAAWRVMFRHELRLWLRLAPVVTGYVMICELVDCFTLLSTGSAMLEFGCLFAGLTIAIDRYARGKMKLPEEPVPAQAQELPAEAPSAEAPAEVQP